MLLAKLPTTRKQAHPVRQSSRAASCRSWVARQMPASRVSRPPRRWVAAARAAWEEEVIARRARKEAERLESLFQEYRVERKKEEKRKQKPK